MTFNQLKEIGLTEYEIKVYEALLELGESTKTPAEKAELNIPLENNKLLNLIKTAKKNRDDDKLT